MKQDKALNDIYDYLKERALNGAILRMENYLAINPHQINSDRLFAIKTDYQVMKDYWRKGFKDSQLSQQYDKLLRRMYVLYANVSTNARVLHSPFLASLFMRDHLSPRDWSVQVLREQLEAFVSDIAMLDLEPAHTSQERRKELYRQHHQMMGDVFAHILTSDVWTDGQGEEMQQLLLSPTVDSVDQQIIISAITLAAMNCFDMVKFRTLMSVYQQSSDEYVRQRAFVGWVLAIDDEDLKGIILRILSFHQQFIVIVIIEIDAGKSRISRNIRGCIRYADLGKSSVLDLIRHRCFNLSVDRRPHPFGVPSISL